MLSLEVSFPISFGIFFFRPTWNVFCSCANYSMCLFKHSLWSALPTMSHQMGEMYCPIDGWVCITLNSMSLSMPPPLSSCSQLVSLPSQLLSYTFVPICSMAHLSPFLHHGSFPFDQHHCLKIKRRLISFLQPLVRALLTII